MLDRIRIGLATAFMIFAALLMLADSTGNKRLILWQAYLVVVF